MKAVRDFRAANDAEEGRKGTKLPPMKKSGKERYELYGGLDDEDDEDYHVRRESVLDYYDDEEDDL